MVKTIILKLKGRPIIFVYYLIPLFVYFIIKGKIDILLIN